MISFDQNRSVRGRATGFANPEKSNFHRLKSSPDTTCYHAQPHCTMPGPRNRQLPLLLPGGPARPMTDTRNIPEHDFHSFCADLAPLLRMMLQVCALLAVPTNDKRVRQILREANLPATGATVPEHEIRAAGSALEQLHLISSDYRARADIIEMVTRSSLADGHFETLARAVSKTEGFYPVPAADAEEIRYQRALRDIRFAVYRHDVDRFHKGLISTPPGRALNLRTRMSSVSDATATPGSII